MVMNVYPPGMNECGRRESKKSERKVTDSDVLSKGCEGSKEGNKGGGRRDARGASNGVLVVLRSPWAMAGWASSRASSGVGG